VRDYTALGLATRGYNRCSMRPAGRFLSDEQLVPTLLFILLVGFAVAVPAQNDTWWHLRSGLEMWRTKHLLTTEAFSYTAYGAPLGNHWWLSQILFYGAYALGGLKAVSAFAGGCALAAVALSYGLIRGTTGVRFALLPLLIFATEPSWVARPQVISMLLLALTARLIVADRVRWLPVLCVVWANAHALVVLGVAVAGVVAIEAIVWSREHVRRDVAIAILCAVAPTVSPLGVYYWPRVLATVSMSRALRLDEYRAPLQAADFSFWIVGALLAWVTWTQRRTLASRPRADRIALAASWVLAVAAATAARNIAFFAILALPAVSRLLHVPAARRVRPPRPAGWPAYVIVAGTIAFTTILVGLRWRDHGAAIGWTPMPPALVQAIRQCPDPIFNPMADGGPLMWAVPDRRVFIDSRMEAYPLALFRRSQRADVAGDYADLFRDYHIGCAMVATPSPMGERMAGDESMTKVYQDLSHAVYRRADFTVP